VFRSAPWDKLLVLWKLTSTWKVLSQYDYILYLDSDAIINPLQRDQSFKDFLLRSANPSNVEWGRGVANSTFSFLSNLPWTDPYPCTGVFVVNLQVRQLSGENIARRNGAAAMLKEWWDFRCKNSIMYSTTHDFEQGAFRGMIYEGHSIVGTSTYLKERQFPPSTLSSWIRHFGGGWASHRVSEMKNLLRDVLHYDATTFREAIMNIRASYEETMRIGDIASEIRDSKSTVNQSEEPLLVRLHHARSVYVITHGLRRLITNVAAAEMHHFDLSKVIIVSDDYLQQYPVGPWITTEDD
jgi:hypothetical protein